MNSNTKYVFQYFMLKYSTLLQISIHILWYLKMAKKTRGIDKKNSQSHSMMQFWHAKVSADDALTSRYFSFLETIFQSRLW